MNHQKETKQSQDSGNHSIFLNLPLVIFQGSDDEEDDADNDKVVKEITTQRKNRRVKEQDKRYGPRNMVKKQNMSRRIKKYLPAKENVDKWSLKKDNVNVS